MIILTIIGAIVAIPVACVILFAGTIVFLLWIDPANPAPWSLATIRRVAFNRAIYAALRVVGCAKKA